MKQLEKFALKKKTSDHKVLYGVLAGVVLAIALGVLAAPKSWKTKVRDLEHQVRQTAKHAELVKDELEHPS